MSLAIRAPHPTASLQKRTTLAEPPFGMKTYSRYSQVPPGADASPAVARQPWKLETPLRRSCERSSFSGHGASSDFQTKPQLLATQRPSTTRSVALQTLNALSCLSVSVFSLDAISTSAYFHGAFMKWLRLRLEVAGE